MFTIIPIILRSNIRLLDCINRPKDLIYKAIELGLDGIGITDHECVSSHVQVNKIAKEIKKEHPDFKIVLGNEIYLTENREKGQKYYHFLLLAKNAIGHRALNELSSIAWYNIFEDRRMERVPTLKVELEQIVQKYPNSLIATTACMGGELSTLALEMYKARQNKKIEEAKFFHDKIVEFISFCKRLFGEDFYIECAPSAAKEQIIVNRQLYNISKALNIKLITATDSHYLTKEDRWVHKAYLTSREGDREVDDFYEYSRLMDEKEVKELLMLSFENEDIINWILENTIEIKNKIEDYDLERKQIIPKVDVKNYPPRQINDNIFLKNCQILRDLLVSDEVQERYWVTECLVSLREKGLDKSQEYYDRLEIEADIIKDIGNKLEDCLFAYFNTFKHYIDLFWECGSIVGPGRGSATGFLSNYLLGITQLDPVRWSLPYWRFLNKERAELPDIDIDLAPSRRPAIFEAIRQERGEFGLIQVATFGTETTKSAILTACRGYRSEEYPNGIDVDDAQYLSSLIEQERGFLFSVSDTIYGNEEKGRAPNKTFIHAASQYPGLIEIIIRIEGSKLARYTFTNSSLGF